MTNDKSNIIMYGGTICRSNSWYLGARGDRGRWIAVKQPTQATFEVLLDCCDWIFQLHPLLIFIVGIAFRACIGRGVF